MFSLTQLSKRLTQGDRRQPAGLPALGVPRVPVIEALEGRRLLSAEALSPVQLFLGSQRREERVFMGDWTFWSRVRDLAEAATPLVSAQATHV